MIEKRHPQLSVRRQASLVDVNRNRIEPKEPKRTKQDVKIMNVLDKLHMKEPSYGARRFKVVLNRDHGFRVGRGRLRRLSHPVGLKNNNQTP